MFLFLHFFVPCLENFYFIIYVSAVMPCHRWTFCIQWNSVFDARLKYNFNGKNLNINE